MDCNAHASILTFMCVVLATLPDDHVTGDSTPFTSLRVVSTRHALLRSVGLTGKSGNKFIARILSDFLSYLLHHNSVSYWIPPTRFDARKDIMSLLLRAFIFGSHSQEVKTR
ncbi:hypothetical protein EDD22DRAFT_295428 [Suillus occidentalis]|nr:hypothetical protein EDD22DRAFT_295428 [Suillus occidentalis]